MAFRINCGKPEPNEVAALNRLSAELPGDWALLTNIPRHLTGPGAQGREIDALALSPLGAVVIELKHFGGQITVTPVGEWIVTGKILTDKRGMPQYPLQQAGKAAQILKGALGSAAGSVYIDACAVATRPGASIRFSDPARPQAIMALDQAVSGIESLAAKTQGVSYASLQAFFGLVGHGIPAPLDSIWRARFAARPAERRPSPARHPRSRATRKYSGPAHHNPAAQGPITAGWIVIAAIVGSLVGWVILTFFSPS